MLRIASAFIAAATLLLAGQALGQETSKVYIFPDTAKNRAALVSVGQIDGVAMAAASWGGTTVVNIAGNGFDRGIVIDGLRSAERKAFQLTGTPVASVSVAKGLANQANTLGLPKDIIIVLPTKVFPPWCIYAVCLPEDWLRTKNDGVTDPPPPIDFDDGGISSGGGFVINGMNIPQIAKDIQLGGNISGGY